MIRITVRADGKQEVSGIVDSNEELAKVAELLGTPVHEGTYGEPGQHHIVLYADSRPNTGHTTPAWVSVAVGVGNWIWVITDGNERTPDSAAPAAHDGLG